MNPSRIISPIASAGHDEDSISVSYRTSNASTPFASSFFANTTTPKFSPINVNIGLANGRMNRNNVASMFESADRSSSSGGSGGSSRRHYDEIGRSTMNTTPVSIRRVAMNFSASLNENKTEDMDLGVDVEDDDRDEQAKLGESDDSKVETDEERRRREEEESEALARQLMAEEAMASYHQSTHFLQENAHEYSEEDLAALRAIMAEENPVISHSGEGDEYEEEEEDDIDASELSYEALLDLGERIGDVKSERWAMRARDEIAKLPMVNYCRKMSEGKDHNDSCVKCLVCQFDYQEKDCLRILPCGHYFHQECVDEWLLAKDICPYCRQSIIQEN